MDYAAIQGQRCELQVCDKATESSLSDEKKVLMHCPFLSSAVYILLGAGGLMMIVGFFGCFGAVRESQCLLASVGQTAGILRKKCFYTKCEPNSSEFHMIFSKACNL